MDWQPIETAPKDGTHILVYDPDGVMFVAFWSGAEWLNVASPTGYLGYSATHWMPLPAPPETQND